MNTKIILATLSLAFAPGIATAMGCGADHIKQTASCQPGTSWDADAGTCVATPTG